MTSLSPCEIVPGDWPKTPTKLVSIPLDNRSMKPVLLHAHLLQNFRKKIGRQIIFTNDIYKVADLQETM